MDTELSAEICAALKQQGVTSMDVLLKRVIKKYSDHFIEIPPCNKGIINNKMDALREIKQKSSLVNFSEELRNDKEVVLEAVKQRGSNLFYASDDLKNDHEVVTEAVKQNPNALYYASQELRNDRQIVLEAIKIDTNSFARASEKLRADKEFVLEAIRQSQNCDVLQHVSKKIKNDKGIILEAVKKDVVSVYISAPVDIKKKIEELLRK